MAAQVTILQKAQSGNANGTALHHPECLTITIQIVGATFTGTVNFEGSLDGVNWAAISLNDGTGSPKSTATADGIFGGTALVPYFRARTSGVSAGSVTVTARSIS